MSLKGICIKDKKIESDKQWPEPQLVQDIPIFLGFTNFYKQLIHGFNRITALLILMLKTSESVESLTQPGKGRVRVGNDNRARYGNIKLDGSGISHNEVDHKVDDEVRKKGRNPTKSKSSSKSKKTESGFLTYGARMAFIKLRQVFINAPILQHFNPEGHIWIEIDVSGYAIGGVLN